MLPAFIIGIVVGLTLGAVLVDVCVVQPMQRENRDLVRENVKALALIKDWREFHDHKQRHRGTPYMPSTVERAKVRSLLADIAARAEADTLDHSMSAELRVVR